MLVAANDVPCNLCGSLDQIALFEAGIAQINRIVECKQCGLMFSSPRSRPVDQEAIRDYDPQLTSNVADYDPTRFRKERLQVRDYADTRAELARLYPDRGSLVEIGCGMGFQLEAFAAEGWDVTGIEPDRGFCEFIAYFHGLKALPTILEEAGLPDASVDVVVFLHVIEHVPDPLGTLKSIFRLLKPGGHLVIETPRFDSLMYKLFGHRERSLNCNGHIYFFTTRSLRQMCEKAGFEYKQCNYVGRSLSLERVAWNIGVMSQSEIVQTTLRKLSAGLKLDTMQVRLNTHDMQRIIIRKPDGR
jgi:2-polyprenyl-3-methyl-5-hydroxy-6-metoxy-1,4-benzoquinol methylase